MRLSSMRGRSAGLWPLLAVLVVLRAYGAYGEKMNYGKKTVGVIRSTFVIGADGRVERAYYNVRATGHVERLRNDLAA